MGKTIILLFFFTLISFSCDEPNLPKQNGFLRIEFKEPYYSIYEEIDIPYNFYYNSRSAKLNQINSEMLLFDYKDLNLSFKLSYYNISGMDETKLHDNLEYLSSIIRPPKEYYNKKS